MEKNGYATAPAYQQQGIPQPMPDAAIGANYQNQRELPSVLFLEQPTNPVIQSSRSAPGASTK